MKTSLCRIRPHVLGTILLKGPFNPPQTLNGQIIKGTNSLIRLIGVTTAKWLQNGAALLFLSKDVVQTVQSPYLFFNLK